MEKLPSTVQDLIDLEALEELQEEYDTLVTAQRQAYQRDYEWWNRISVKQARRLVPELAAIKLPPLERLATLEDIKSAREQMRSARHKMRSAERLVLQQRALRQRQIKDSKIAASALAAQERKKALRRCLMCAPCLEAANGQVPVPAQAHAHSPHLGTAAADTPHKQGIPAALQACLRCVLPRRASPEELAPEDQPIFLVIAPTGASPAAQPSGSGLAQSAAVRASHLEKHGIDEQATSAACSKPCAIAAQAIGLRSRCWPRIDGPLSDSHVHDTRLSVIARIDLDAHADGVRVKFQVSRGGEHMPRPSVGETSSNQGAWGMCSAGFKFACGHMTATVRRTCVEALTVVDTPNGRAARAAGGRHRKAIVVALEEAWHNSHLKLMFSGDAERHSAVVDDDATIISRSPASSPAEAAETPVARATRIFEAIDVDRSGVVDREELYAHVKRNGVPDEMASKVFRSIDANQDSQIALPEWLRAYAAHA